MDIEVSLTPERAAEEAAPPLVATDTARDRPSAPAGLARVAPWTWAMLGLGAVGLGGAVGFEVARAGAERDADEAQTQLEHQEHFRAMEDRQLLARVLLGVGAVATAAGGVLLYFDLSRDPDSGPHDQADRHARDTALAPSPGVSWRVGAGCAGALCQAVGHARF
jgi:hypothetical protein